MDGRKILAVAAVPAVMAFGAPGFASQQRTAQPKGSAPQARTARPENTRADPDDTQQGDRTSPGKPGQAEEQGARAPDRDNIRRGSGNQVEDGRPDVPVAAEAAGR